MGSSHTKDRTHVPCIGRRVLNHYATREVPPSDFILHQWFSASGDFPTSLPPRIPGDTWQCLETFLVVTLQGQGCYCSGVARDQKLCEASPNAQDSPLQPRIIWPQTSEKPCTTFWLNELCFSDTAFRKKLSLCYFAVVPRTLIFTTASHSIQSTSFLRFLPLSSFQLFVYDFSCG